MGESRTAARRASMMRWALLVGVVALLAGGCSDDSGGGDGDGDGGGDADLISDTDSGGDAGDAGDVDAGPQPCSAAQPCPEGEVCDPVSETCAPRCEAGGCEVGQACDLLSGLCVDGQACATVDDCAASGAACDRCRGVCIGDEGKDRCLESINCSSAEYCATCTELCEPRPALCEACAESRECGGASDQCVDLVVGGGRFCAQACAISADCPAGYTCADLGGASRQCVPASGDCAAPAECEDDAGCRGISQICQDGRCAQGCTDSGSCPQGNVCELGRCLPPCPGRACAQGTVCDAADGVCELEGACRTSGDCPDAETHCDPATKQCVAGCLVDNDCLDASLACVDGACEPRGCVYNFVCGFEQVCEAGSCVDAVGPYCDACDPEDDAACGGAPNQCLSLQDDEGNDLGSFCFVACEAGPDNRCPQGYQCAPLQDGEGNPTGDEVCFRDCTYDPWGGSAP